MFQTIKSQIPLLAVIQKDTGLTFKQTGENFVIEDEEEQGGCPFCGHRGCFKVLTTCVCGYTKPVAEKGVILLKK